MPSEEYLLPEWPAPKSVKAITTRRARGRSEPPYESFNLASHVGDDPARVDANRKKLHVSFGFPQVFWMNQVHGTDVYQCRADNQPAKPVTADACWADTHNLACAVLTADCLPVLVCNRSGTRIVAIHAGWRGLASGIISVALAKAKMDPQETLVWLGPAIGPDVYQVGEDVLTAFKKSIFFQGIDITSAFTPDGENHYLCDLYMLARLQLANLGISNVYGGDQCTFTQEEDYFSYRRDGQTGRIASLIWLE